MSSAPTGSVRSSSAGAAHDRGRPDGALLAAAAVLTAIGAVMIFSASSAAAYVQFHDQTYYLKREAVWLVLGAVAVFVGLKIDYAVLRKAAPWLYGLAVLTLAAVLVPHLGIIEGGARRWFAFGWMSFQPSEAAKLAVIVLLAKIFAEREDGARSFKQAGLPALVAVVICFGLVLREPDLGTASLLVMTAFAMMFAAGARARHLLAEAALAIPTVCLFVFTSQYRRERFMAFIHPWKDPQGSGYHIIQSLYALGSGGLFGLGLGESRQKFGYLPEQYTDFIFAIIGEELGLIGALTIVGLFLFLAYRGMRIALQADDRFGYHLAVGITASLVIQAFVNIGVVTSSWPVTGVPLPFISYGGTSLLASLFSVGLLAGISKGRSRDARAGDVRERAAQDERRARKTGAPRVSTKQSALRRFR